jgi:hypothetical protein
VSDFGNSEIDTQGSNPAESLFDEAAVTDSVARSHNHTNNCAAASPPPDRSVLAFGAACRSLPCSFRLWVASSGDTMMKQVLVYGAVVALAIFNGIFSPHSFLVFALQGIWYPSFLPAPLNMMFILSGIISGVLHLLATGIPVAILERRIPLQRLSAGLLWVGVMVLPTVQTIRHLGLF